jgi:acyl carrier protein
MVKQDIQRQLIAFVLERHPNPDHVHLDADTDLFAGGHLDSIGFIGLTVLVEELSGNRIDFERHDVSNMTTIGKIIEHFF